MGGMRLCQPPVHPNFSVRGPAANARAVVLVLPGGEVTSTTPARRGLAWARMLPFALGIAHRARHAQVAVWLVRYRVIGWNGAAQDPVVDTRWLLEQARQQHPGAPIVLVGHSMGGRVALRLADQPDVAGVCALAPWLEPDDPDVVGRGTVLIAHGLKDKLTDPTAAAAYAARIGATFVPVAGDSHSMLCRPVLWQHVVIDYVTRTLGAAVRNPIR